MSQGSFTSQADDPSLSSDSYMTEGGEYIAPGWIPDRRPMYLGVSSVPLPGQRSAANHSQRSATQTSSRPEKRSLTSVSWAECENDGSSTVEPLAGASSPVQANSKFSGELSSLPACSLPACCACDVMLLKKVNPRLLHVSQVIRHCRYGSAHS